MLLDRIKSDLVTSMKSKDTFSLNVIRMVKASIQMEAINKKRDLTDEEIISVIEKQIKMRKDAIIEFEKGNRADLVEQNTREIELLQKYMPEQLSDEEVNSIIDEAFKLIKPTSGKDMGLIMKEVTPKLKGRTDMSKVSAIIREKLN